MAKSSLRERADNKSQRTSLESMPRILVVDDEPGIRKLISRIIETNGYRCDAAGTLADMRLLLGKNSYDIVLVDLQLPDGSGLSILDEQGVVPQGTIVLIITGQQNLEPAIQAIRRGTYDYIRKPFGVQEFGERLGRAVEEWRSRTRYRYYQDHLEALVNQQTEALRETTREIERVYDAAVHALGAALDLKDPETEEHCRRVARNSVRLGKAMGLPKEQLRNLSWSAYLHDIGKIGIPEHVLGKAASLDPQEMEIVKAHPLMGFRMISSIDFLKSATDVVLYHHERYDGSGYPYGLKGQDIPLAARIFAAIDALDAITSDRPYRKAQPFSAVVEELKRGAGKQFDPDIVERFLQIPQQDWGTEKTIENVSSETRIVDAEQSFKEARRQITWKRREIDTRLMASSTS
jgi:response regulator RpfG family c-di-GMP phosphodiesterase